MGVVWTAVKSSAQCVIAVDEKFTPTESSEADTGNDGGSDEGSDAGEDDSASDDETEGTDPIFGPDEPLRLGLDDEFVYVPPTDDPDLPEDGPDPSDKPEDPDLPDEGPMPEDRPEDPPLPDSGPSPRDKPESPARGPAGDGSGSAAPPAAPKVSADPLVLDLGGDGIVLMPVTSSRTLFDMDGDGVLETTGWVSPDDALLVLDANRNGEVDGIDELFGNGSVSGFEELRTLDDNGDGVFDGADAAFVEVQVWQDRNSNGAVDDGELRSLSDVGVEAISLDVRQPTADEAANGGNRVDAIGSLILNGEASEIAAVTFGVDQLNSRVPLSEEFEISPDAATLPELRGYGDLPNLSVAMTNDIDLLSSVREFVASSSSLTDVELREGVEELLYQWTNAAGTASGSRGLHIDARKVAALSTYYGDDHFAAQTSLSEAWANEAENAFAAIVDNTLAKLLPQLAISSYLLAEEPSFSDLMSHGLVPFAAFGYDPEAETIDGTFNSFLDIMLAHDGIEIASDQMAAYRSLLSVYASVGYEGDQAALTDALQFSVITEPLLADDQARWIAGVANGITESHDGTVSADVIQLVGGSLVRGLDGDDTLRGSEDPDVLDGGRGDDMIDAGGGADVLIGGAGEDLLMGGSGADTYVWSRGDGSDVIVEGVDDGRIDRLLLNVEPTAAVFSQAPYDFDAILITITESVQGAGDGGVLVLEASTDEFLSSGIEEIVFADGTVLGRERIRELADVQPNHAPTAGNDGFEVDEGGVLAIDAATLLRNDTDADGDVLSVVSVEGSPSLDVQFDGVTIVVTPLTEYSGTEYLSYTVADGKGGMADGTIAVSVNAINDAPVVDEPVDLTRIEEDGSRTITAAELLVGASDIDGDALTIVDLAASSGTLVEDGDGAWSYTPDADMNGEVTFNYRVSDGELSAEQTATLDVTTVNDAPIVPTGPLTLAASAEDVVRFVSWADLLDGITDVDGDALSVASISVASGNGTLEVVDGGVNVTPAVDDDTAIELAVTITDGTVQVNRVASFDLTAVNDGPVVTGEVVLGAIDEDSARTITSAELLENATDVDGDALSVENLAVSSGTLTDNGDGTWTYAPDADMNGEIDLTYAVSDGTVSVSRSTSVAVTPINDDPVVAGTVELGVGDEDRMRVVTAASLLAGASDADGDDLSVLNLTASSGTLTDVGDGTWEFVPDANDDTEVTFAFDVTDGEQTVAQTATLDLTPVNDAPDGYDDVGATMEAGTSAILTAASLLANDADIEGDTLTIASVGDAVGGTVALDANGNVVFEASVGFDGTATFSYTVDDGSGTATATDSATVSIEVTAPDEPREPTDPYADFFRGTDGNDRLIGSFWSENRIFGADGNDYIHGGMRNDHLAGGNGNDRLVGKLGDDVLEGDAGNDRLWGGLGEDVLSGGGGNDHLFGGFGADEFVYRLGDGRDTIYDFGTGALWWAGDDKVRLEVDGIDSFADVQDAARQAGRHTVLDFGDGDTLVLRNIQADDLSADDFVF